MNIEEVYKIIRCWELDAGESFIEYFGDNFCGIDDNEIMEWMLQKGYITEEKLSIFKENDSKWKTISECMNGYEVDYALFPYGECDEEANFKSELIIAEYLIEKNKLEKLEMFAFEGKGWASFKNEQNKKKYQEQLKHRISKWDDEDHKEYEKILALSIDEINERLEMENN